MATKLTEVSILTVGDAKGHNLKIDETSLQQALQVAQTMGRIKVTNGHGAGTVMDILGYVENFKIKGDRLLGDLTLLDGEKAAYVARLADEIPDQFGLSLTFSGMPEEKDGSRFARVTEIYDVSVVVQPAANASLFTAFSRLPVDTLRTAMTETKSATVELTAAAPVAAPQPEPAAAPAAEPKAELAKAVAPVAAEEKHDEEDKEPTLRDVISKLDTLLGYMTKEREEEMQAELAPEPVAAEAKAETKELSNESAGLKAELATMKVELEAARGTKPLETSSAQVFSRNELMAQFNAEKDNDQRQVLLKKILAR